MGRSESRKKSRNRSSSKDQKSKRSRRSRDRSKSRDEEKNGKDHSGNEDQREPSQADSSEVEDKKPEDYGVDSLKITDDDAAFILGKGGKTKMKIARVSKAEVELFERDLTIEFRGGAKERRHAKRYARCVMAQRTGPVVIDDKDKEDDCTIVEVPQAAVGFVTGKGGNFLRTMEDEWCVIMFFAEYEGAGKGKETEKLAIFGERWGRRGAQLKVMSTVEHKEKGYYTDKDDTYDKDNDGDWGTNTMRLKGDELSYALGKKGMTRKKIAKSSECIVEYVGHTVFFSGPKKNRDLAREYMKWLFDQLDGPVFVNHEGRSDCTVVDVPVDVVGYVTGNRRETLGRMEEQWGSLMFFMGKKGSRDSGDKDRRKGDTEKLLICGSERARKASELSVMSSVEAKTVGFFTKGIREKKSDVKGFDVDRIYLKDDEISYALGKEGQTRKKLANASGAILQYVGKIGFIAGVRKERYACRQYLTWLLEQRQGRLTVDVRDRKDVSEVHIPSNCVGWVTGNRGMELRRVENESQTFCFMANDQNGDERLLIFGPDEGSKHEEAGRMKAERLVNDLIHEKLRKDDRRKDSRSRSRSHKRRKDSRSPSRKRARKSPSGRRARRVSPRRRSKSRDRSPSRYKARSSSSRRSRSRSRRR